MKEIPIGVDNFKKMITNNYYFVDKTKFIEEVIHHAEVKLFTRPRRFGKTLTLSMLKYFFNIENAEENKKLFSGLYIEKSPVFSEQGKYPVISINMKRISGTDFDDMLNDVKLMLSKLFTHIYENFEQLSETTKEICIKYKNQHVNKSEIRDGLLQLSEILHDYHNQKVIILIDEYDTPLVHAFTKGYYDDAVEFFKTFYGNVLKSNDYLLKAVMTGIIRVASAGIFSDLNNLDVYTVLTKEYDEYFGLTEAEVVKALKDFNLEYKINEVKSWYNGYKFGNKEIYNPWSIINFIKYKELKAYWVNTSGNDLIREILCDTNELSLNDIQNLINGKFVSAFIGENVSLGANISTNNIWELLLFSGYITTEKQTDNDNYDVRIPNKEVEILFKKIFTEFLFVSSSTKNDLVNSLKEKNVKKIIDTLKKLVLNVMSYYDTNNKYENTYHMLLLGFMSGINEYITSSNLETGYGRADIVLNPKDKKYPGYIFELKRAGDSEDLKEVAKTALKQINEKKYDSKLINEGVTDIVKIGLAFSGKEVEAVFEI